MGIHVKPQQKNTAQSVVAGETESCRNSNDSSSRFSRNAALEEEFDALVVHFPVTEIQILSLQSV